MPLGDEGPGQSEELAGKVLVNESDLHRLPLEHRTQKWKALLGPMLLIF
jgi:hypothetical protein